jgi:hypothetical protein
VLLCVVVCCGVLWCVVVCCGVLLCVVVCKRGGEVSLQPVFRIRIHRIHMLGLLDPDPDPPSSCKNSKKNLDSFDFVTLFDFLSLKNDVNVPSKSSTVSRKNCDK